MLTPHEYYLETNDKSFDMDGAYGMQCWDLFAHFCKKAGYPIINCTSSGYVKDIWNDRKSNGVLENFNEKSVCELQDGDWAVWGNCAACPRTHIAMYRKDNGNGTGIFLGQNQGSKKVNQRSLPYYGILGVLRPKCYVKGPFADSDKPDAVYKIGDVVSIKEIYSSADSSTPLNPAISSGIITKIYPDKRNPYLLNNGDGFVNNHSIISEKTSIESEISIGDRVTPQSRYDVHNTLLIKEVLTHTYVVTQIKDDRVLLGDGLNTWFYKKDVKKSSASRPA